MNGKTDGLADLCKWFVILAAIFFTSTFFGLVEGTLKMSLALIFDLADAVELRRTQAEDNPDAWLGGRDD